MAHQRRPVKNLGQFRRRITAALPELLSPQHTAVKLLVIEEEADQGFILLDVPSSDDRPHMSVPEQRYFRRGSDGTRVLFDYEVREMLFAPRSARIEIESAARIGVSTGDLRYAINVGLKLRNVGKVPIIAPYLRLHIKGTVWGVTQNISDFVKARAAAEGTWGFYAARDTLIHVGDEMTLAELGTGLDFRYAGQRDLPSAIALVRKDGFDQSCRMLPFGEMSNPLRDAKDRPVQVSGVFGAENAPATHFSLTVGKEKLLDLFCQDTSIAALLRKYA